LTLAQALDKERGAVYYYNRSKGKKTWKKPAPEHPWLTLSTFRNRFCTTPYFMPAKQAWLESKVPFASAQIPRYEDTQGRHGRPCAAQGAHGGSPSSETDLNVLVKALFHREQDEKHSALLLPSPDQEYAAANSQLRSVLSDDESSLLLEMEAAKKRQIATKKNYHDSRKVTSDNAPKCRLS